MSKGRAHVLAVELLAELPTVDLHGQAFAAWCLAHDLDAAGAHAVRVAVIRARAFGRMGEAPAAGERGAA